MDEQDQADRAMQEAMERAADQGRVVPLTDRPGGKRIGTVSLDHGPDGSIVFHSQITDPEFGRQLRRSVGDQSYSVGSFGVEER